MKLIREDDSARFWSKVDKTDTCWNWIGTLDRSGYGMMSISENGKSKMTGAHRWSYWFFKEDISEGMFVCHSCDNRRCVNPNHLWLGTNQDNMKDMSKKNRNAKGSQKPTSKLSEEDVPIIRALYILGWYCKDIGRRFGIHENTIHAIINNRTWKHVV